MGLINNYLVLLVFSYNCFNTKCIKTILNMILQRNQFKKNKFGLVWFGGFYGISTFVGYLTPNPFLFT